MTKKAGPGFFLADLSSNILVVFLILFTLVSLVASHAPLASVDIKELSSIKLDSGKEFVDTLYAYETGHSAQRLFIEISGVEIRSSPSDWSARRALTGDEEAICSALSELSKQGNPITVFVLAELPFIHILKSNCFDRHIPELLFVPRALKGSDRDWSPQVRQLMASQLGPETFQLHLLQLLEGGSSKGGDETLQDTILASFKSTLKSVLRWGDFIASLFSAIVVLVVSARRMSRPSAGEF